MRTRTEPIFIQKRLIVVASPEGVEVVVRGVARTGNASDAAGLVSCKHVSESGLSKVEHMQRTGARESPLIDSDGVTLVVK